MHFNQALNEYKKQNYPSAISQLNEAIKEREEVYHSLILKGKILRNKNKYSSSKQILLEATQVDSSAGQAFAELGAVETALGNYGEALDLYRRSLFYDDKNWKTYFYKGYTLWRTQKFNEAFSSFRKAITLNPLNNPKVYIGTAASAAKLGYITQAKKYMEYSKKSMQNEENVKLLLPSEQLLINKVFGNYDAWCKELEIDLRVTKQSQQQYVHIVNQIFKAVYLNNKQLWDNTQKKIQQQVLKVKADMMVVQAGSCQCQIF